MWSKEAEEDREEWEGEQDGILIASAMLIQHSGDLVPQTQILSFLLSLARGSFSWSHASMSPDRTGKGGN